jgi:hypothetical protein
MSKAQNRNMGRERRQGNTTLQKTSSNIIEDLMKSEGDEFSVAELRWIMIRMFNELKVELKENIQSSGRWPKQCIHMLLNEKIIK